MLTYYRLEILRELRIQDINYNFAMRWVETIKLLKLHA